jgi:hypothetical protein
MSDPKVLDELDEQIRRASEQFARLTNRRRFLRGALETGFAIYAGIALGSLRSAIAIAADGGCKQCNPLQGTYCAGCPSTIGPGCPSGCSVCKNCGCTINGQHHCCYTTGYWSVTGCGTCGNGTRYCTDCKCPDCNGGCTCRGGCYCCGCCSPQDVAVELGRLRESGELQLLPLA